MNDIWINADKLDFLMSFLVSSLGFVFYLSINTSLLSGKKFFNQGNNVRQVLFQRMNGVLFFGILSVVLISGFSNHTLKDFGINKPGQTISLWAVIFGIVTMIITYLNAPSEKNLRLYPQIRCERWTYKIFLLSSISWTLYLFAFEFLYRGYFFFSSLRLIGPWPAIFLNTAIYALIHIPKGNREMLGSVPVGIIFCYLTYITESIWLSFFIHLVMAIANEFFSIRAHPKMNFVKSWK